MQTADLFQLMSRKAFPFVSFDSTFFAAFSPIIWIAGALLFLSLGIFFSQQKDEIFSRRFLPFTLLAFSSIVFWIFAPDDFGKSHGSFLRERVLLCGLICFVPLFKTGDNFRFLSLARICLIIVIVFQTAILWEYSFYADSVGREYLSAKEKIGNNDSIGSILLMKNSCRYKSNPLTNINVLNGIGKNTRVWDNYELGYYLFPVIALNQSDKDFIYNFRESNAFELCDANEKMDEKLARLTTLLELNNEKIGVMVVWGKDERIEAFLKKWYKEPFFQNERVSIYAHQ
jgi:hypothetical protein